MQRRILLYTGITCGKCPVVLVGRPTAVAIAVHGIAGRRPKLREWLAVTAPPVGYPVTSVA
jgi:hypothetical protein